MKHKHIDKYELMSLQSMRFADPSVYEVFMRITVTS